MSIYADTLDCYVRMTLAKRALSQRKKKLEAKAKSARK
jgi:hypothetical protein